MNFPDLQHLVHLQENLWQWPKSRAAVMVGAGLSLNAEPRAGVIDRFPTWRELARIMFDELHPTAPDDTPAQAQEREGNFNRANPLRIASEYEAAFGRRKLDLLVCAQIPDTKFEPGVLHSLLLQLPWVDVFTTNYDTLLERTEIAGRTYQPVTKASELTTAFDPRIVKLHGSLPSQTPFIISEEDYRTYPKLFAPFVNSVRQSLLENSFVLVGFSGDDPNFLEWTGWIRDELGGEHAPIYLVGPLSLNNAGRSLLSQRGVTPIDLSPLFAGAQRPIDPYAASLEWFLKYLLAARPSRPERWPELQSASVSVPAGNPSIPSSGTVAPVETGSRPKPGRPLNAETIGDIYRRWRLERQNYPGWLVAREQKRSKLWDETKTWIPLLIDRTKEWSPIDRVLLFREINWRTETSMVPLFEDWVDPFQKTLDSIFEDLTSSKTFACSPELITSKEASAPEAADAWLQLAFSLLRDARESCDESRWKELKAKIDRVVQHPQHYDQSCYQAALWSMWNLDRQSAKDTIAHWHPSPNSPLAAMRKAGLLAEVDELGEARAILQNTLLEVRRALRNQGRNIELLSLEGWCSYLLNAVVLSLDFTQHRTLWGESRERWEELKAWDCSPWTHIEYFEDVLSFPPPRPQKDEQEVRGFDPGHVSITMHFGTDYIRPYLPGFAYIRLYEQVGIPMRLRSVNIAGNMLKDACNWVAPVSRFWTPAVLVRAGKIKDITDGDFLSRTQVAAMDPALAKRIYIWCMRVLRTELSLLNGRIPRGSAQEAVVEILPEMLSRLAFTVDASELRKTFPFALGLHVRPELRSHMWLHRACEPWFLRLFEAADAELLLEWLPSLIRAPLFDTAVRTPVPQSQAWPDPMQHVPDLRVRKPREKYPHLMTKVDEATDWLLARASSESGEGRNRAIDRLIYLYHTKLMTTAQQQQLGELLWSQRTAAGLPDRPGFAFFGFLHLPAPPGVDVNSAVKKCILSLRSTGVVQRGADGSVEMSVGAEEQSLIYEAALATKPIIQLAGESLGTVQWDSEEAKLLYQKAREWWANDKKGLELAKENPFVSGRTNPVSQTLARMGQFLSRIVLPRMDWAGESDWRELLDWLREIRDVGSYPTVALPYVLLRRPTEEENVAETINADLNSDNEAAVAAAVKALRHWIHLFAAGHVSAPPATLKATVVERVVFRRKAGVRSCLSQLARLVAERPETIDTSQAELLIASLIPWHHATIWPRESMAPREFHEADLPELRSQLGRLAAALGILHTGRFPEKPEPPAIRAWRGFCEASALPEVRRAFDAWDYLQ